VTVCAHSNTYPSYHLRKGSNSAEGGPSGWGYFNSYSLRILLGQNRLSLNGMYMWDVKSTKTKHSDYIIWKDTSEHVARCCDKNWVNSCVLTHLFWELNNQKIAKKKTFSDALLMYVFNFRGWRHKKKMFSARFFKTTLRTFIIDEIFRGARFWEVDFFTGYHLQQRRPLQH